MKRIAWMLALAIAFGAAASQADEHRSDRAGHPLKIIAVILHPVGVMLDYAIFRPAHWLAHYESVKTMTGHEEE